MVEQTPNKHHIDQFLERLEDRYEYENLREWPLERLEGEEWKVRIEFEIFEASFPWQDSVLQGDYRAYLSDDPTEDKESLTEIEKMRLYQEKQNIISDINRAIGTRKKQRRKQRTDFVEAIAKIPMAIYATVKEIKFW